MENNNTDWMAVQTQVGDATFADIYNLGVDPSSVTLDTKDTYKNKKKIKENPAFQSNGKFDDKKFDDYYDMSVKTLNAYKSSDFSIGTGNLPDLNLWEDTTLARALGQKIHKDPITISINKDPQTNLRLAQKSNLGFIDINEWSNPEKSIAEVAQSQKVIDGITGKELDFTPEDSGLHNAFGFFSEPLVLAAYDSDITDDKGQVLHKRGELKFDEKGMPRYETLAGRNASGKQILSRWDTLTKEDSYINKFDYMDSDGIDKSIVGSVMKTATTLLPLLIGGPVATAAKAYFIADGLIQAGTEISKALTGIAGGSDADKSEFYKSLNGVQAFTKQWKGGTSENAKNNFFAGENILNLASDSVYQLMGQQALAMWPQRIKQYQMAKKLNLNPSILTSLSKGGDEALAGVTRFENYIAKYGDDAGKAAIAMSKNVRQLENMAKYSSYGATAFMAATSAVGISDVADQAGLNARDKGLLYLGYTAGLAPLFRLNIGKWVEGHEIDDLAVGMNRAAREYGSRYLTPVLNKVENEAADDAARLASKEALTGLAKIKDRGLDMLIAGKKLGQSVAARFGNIDNPLKAGMAEGVEEITEEMLMDGVKGIYNGLSELGLTSTDDKKIDFDMGDMMSRYGQAFVGGAIGGMIFKFADPQVKVKPFVSEDMKEYVANGFGHDVIRKIKDMAAQGQLGSTELSINRQLNSNGVLEDSVWAPVNSDNPVSQNDFVADMMIKEIKANMKHMEAFGLDNQEAITYNKDKFYNALVDTRTDTDLRDRIRATSDKLIAVSDEIKTIEDNDINAPAIKKKKEEFKELQEEFEYLTGDESVDEYFRQGLYNINTNINSKFGVKTRQTFTDELVGGKQLYATLNEEDKAKVDEAFNDYRVSNNDTYGIKVDLKNARLQTEKFDQEMKDNGGFERIEKYNESLKTLDEYAVGKRRMVDGKPSEFGIIELSEDFYNKMDKVDYIPDYLHDEIQKRLDDEKMNGLANKLNENVSTGQAPIDSNQLRQILLDGNIGSLNPTRPIDKLFKAYLSKFKPITVFDSPTYTALKSEGDQATLSSMIKSLAEVDGIEDNSPEAKLYKHRSDIINNLDPEQARIFATKIVEDLQYNQSAQNQFYDNHPDVMAQELNIQPKVYEELSKLLTEVGYEDMIDEDAYINSPEEAVNLLKNINRQHFLNASTGLGVKYHFGALATAQPSIMMDHALDDIVNEASSIPVSEMAKAAVETDELISKIETSMKSKATSPLDGFLADTIRFKNTEMESLNKGGAANYLNNSDDYETTINEHIAQVQKVDAYMSSLMMLNPVINEWRKNNPDLVPKDLRDEQLTEITPIGYSTIYQNAATLYNELNYLKELNDYNRNNTLAKLLKEDGKQLSSSFRSLQKISTIQPVSEYLPSIDAFITDPIITEYVADIDVATEEAKIAAIGIATKREDAIYKEFQNLKSEIKQIVLDAVFTPINSDVYEFRSETKVDAPLNDMHQTLYLAKILGTSSIDYTAAIAGQNVDGRYDKIDAAVMDPFPNQESAIRLAYLNRFGDKQVKESLISAFAFKNVETPQSFKRGEATGINIDNTITIIGDPGVGKTKAIIAGVLAFDDDVDSDTVLLGSVSEHVQNLSKGVVDAGYENRINKGLSDTIGAFIKDLELTDSNNNVVPIDTSSPSVLAKLEKGMGNYNNDYESDQRIHNYLKTLADSLTYNVKFWDDKGVLSPIITNKFQGVRNIVVDEFTHANPIDLAILSKVVGEYNKSVKEDSDRKITIILAGDNNQLGFEVAGLSRTFADFVQLPMSVPLTTSLRSGWDLVNNTLTEVKNRTSQLNDMTNAVLQDPVTAANLRNVPIRLTYTVTDGKPIGIYRQEASGETTPEHLTFLTDNLDAIKASENSLVYVVKDIANIAPAEALLRNMLGQDWGRFASVLTAEKTQGREYKYAIIDSVPGKSEKYKIVTTYKFLNTMLSRATEATLLIDKGDFADYATFTQIEVPKAIDQKKLTDEMISGIKENRQLVTRAKLEDTVANPNPGTKAEPEVLTNEQEAKAAVAEEAIATPNEGQTEGEELYQDTINPELDKPADDVTNDLLVLDSEDENALLNLETDAVANVEPTDDFVRTQKYMVNAYTDFTFKRDVDSVNAILNSPIKLTDIEAETSLMKLKEYASYGVKEFTGSYFSNDLILKLRDSGYEIRKTAVRLKAIKRSPEYFTVGRSKWNNEYKEKEGQDLLLVEGIIPNKLGGEPFVYTLGTFNDLENILKFGGDVDSVKQFVSDVKSTLARQQVWESPQFTLDEWRDMSVRREFKLNFKPGVNNRFYDLKRNYNQNLTISEPMVVIAKPSDTNLTLDKWKALIGQTIAFATEHASLRGKSTPELYEIYKNQIKYFNTPEFQNKSYSEKQEYIKTLPKIPGTNLQPKPRLVSLMRLTNPKHNFMEFVTNYNAMVYKGKQAKANGQPFDLAEEVREFEMSIYVADRLVKGLLVVHRMLTDENSAQNKAWFNAEVLPKVKENVLTSIKAFMTVTVEEERAAGNDFNFGSMIPEDFLSSETDITAIRTAEDLVEELEKHIVNNTNLVRGVYKTEAPNLNTVKGIQLDPNVDLSTILPSELTNDKRKDFTSGGILKVKNLSIYNGLKPSYLKMLNETLIALGSIPTNDPNLGKYSLADVFSEGKIENIIVAGVGENGRHLNNVIAPVKTTGLTTGFRTNAANVQSTSFFVDFDKMMEKTTALMNNGSISAQERVDVEQAESYTATASFKQALTDAGVNSNFVEYNELADRVFKNQTEVDEILTQGLQATLKPDTIITNVDQLLSIDTKLNEKVTPSSFLSGPTMTLEISDNGQLVVMQAEYDDRVETHIFDKYNEWKHTMTPVFKEIGNTTNDNAKQIIDQNGLTKENLVERAKSLALDPNKLGRDISSLRGKTITWNTANGPQQVQVVSGSIGGSGELHNSFITLLDENGVRSSHTQADGFNSELINSLPVHSASLAKAEAFYSNPDNLNFDKALDGLMPLGYTDEEAGDIKMSILEQLNLRDYDGLADDVNSSFDRINEAITNLGTIIVNPFDPSNMTASKQLLVDHYETLAKGLYADNIHVLNGFVNNFSIFANGEWEKSQVIIDSVILNGDLINEPGIKEGILKLEEQLNKLTHDC